MSKLIQKTLIIIALSLLGVSSLVSCKKQLKCTCVRSYSDGRPDQEFPNYRLEEGENGQECGTSEIEETGDDGVIVTVTCGEK